MSHRRALLVSLVLTIVVGIGIIVARDRFLTSEAAPEEPLVMVQTLDPVNPSSDQTATDTTAPWDIPSTEQGEHDQELDEIWEHILSGSRHERDDDHEGQWDHDD